MRRLFSFRSSTTDQKEKNGDKNNTDSTESQEDCSSSNDLSFLNLRRSQSFSYPANQIQFEEWRFPHDCESPLQFQRMREQEFSYSPSSKGYNSSPNSPVALKCKPNRCASSANKTLDLYIEEQEDHTASLHVKPPQIQSRTRSQIGTNFEDIYEEMPLGKENDSDEILLRRMREAEERIRVLSNQDYEIEMIKNNNKGVSLASLVCIIREINEDSKNLGFELVHEIKSRLSDRFLAKESFKRVKKELDVRTRRLEREKVEVKLNLERELDRRSNEWSIKIQKFQAEEMRLRERVRELAEQNVGLQREIALYRESESAVNDRLSNSELEMKEMERNLERVKLERNDLLCESKEWQERFKQVQEERNHVVKNFEEKIEENKGLHKAIAKLQILRTEQEKNISELVKGFNGKIEKGLGESENCELVRLVNVEQKLRKEVESCEFELERVRNENKLILDRFNNGDFVSLDLEICARLEGLQSKGLGFLDESSQFCEKLLNFVKLKGENGKIDGLELMDYSLKCESMKRETQNLRRSFKNVATVLDEKFKLKDQISQIGEEKQSNDRFFKDEMALKLKEEVMLNKILREKIFSKELEIEELERETASLIRRHNLHENEIKRLQDGLSNLSHHAKDMKLQLMERDERIKSLQDEFQETITELTSLSSTLKTVTKERDLVLQEVKQLKEANSKLQEEIILLHKKVEEQDEELLIKEGQIEMIKKPFDRWNEL
ncbi:hypothetical protein LUZ60_013213 [Juncus effusus]|nr:hypothetical protein LUZ60_013213 [Juncus effusus]